MLQLARSLQSRPADVVGIIFCLVSADNSLYLLYNSLYFSYSVHVYQLSACFQTSAALLGVLAFMAAAVHACICCLLFPEASHLWCFI